MLGVCLASEAVAQDDDEPTDIRTEIVIIVSEALGEIDEPDPPYFEELRRARTEIDKEFYCSDNHELKSLPDAISKEIAEALAKSVNKERFGAVLIERPAYVADLLVTAISAFEYGRVLTIDRKNLEKLCGTAAKAATVSVAH